MIVKAIWLDHCMPLVSHQQVGFNQSNATGIFCISCLKLTLLSKTDKILCFYCIILYIYKQNTIKNAIPGTLIGVFSVAL